MRFSTIAFAAADASNSGAAANPETPAFNTADASKSNVAAKPSKPARKINASGKRGSGKPSKPAAKRAAKPDTEAPADVYGFKTTYRGASPVFRGHARKLSAIVLGRVAGTYTDRDHAALKALHAQFGEKPFRACDTDRGIISRLEAHKLIRHVSGDLSLRDCTFAVTPLAVKTKLGKTAAPKA